MPGGPEQPVLGGVELKIGAVPAPHSSGPSAEVDLPFIASVTAVYTPIVESTEIDPSFIASVTTVYALTVGYSGEQTVITTPGTYTWICPAGVTLVYVECIAGGGGGYSSFGSYVGVGGGGGGGAYAARTAVPVTPGTSYTFVVGSAGTKGVNGANNGGDGGDSTFTGDSGVQVIAKGGSGAHDDATSQPGGAGGAAGSSTGDVGHLFSGGPGGAGTRGSTDSGGGGGASGNRLATGNSGGAGGPTPATGGAGANGGGSGGNSATNGTAPGGGGGGNNAGVDNAGAGAAGQVTITAFAVPFISSVTTVYPPALVGQEAVPFIPSVTAVYAPTLVGIEPLPFISSVTVVYPPTLSSPSISVPFIGSVTVVYAPSLIGEVDVPFIASRTHVWAIFSLHDPNKTFGGPGNGGESWMIRLAPNGTSVTATLTVNLSATGSTLSLSGDSGLPTDRAFVVTIDSEVMLVSRIGPGNYHVRLRAVSNTTASSHTAGASVVWGDSYDMAIAAGFAIANSFTADINSTGTFTYPGWLICFDSSQAYDSSGARYPMHVSQLLGVFDAGAGSSGSNRCDGPQPSAIHTPTGVSDDCPAALCNPARISSDINVGDVAVLRYTNPEATVLDLGGRSTALQSWFGLKRVDTTDHDVTFTNPNGIVVDTTGTYDTFTGSVNGEWADPVPLVTGIAPDASDFEGVPVPTPNPVPWTTVTLPHADRFFTLGSSHGGYDEEGWPMCCLAVRQGNRRVPYWQSWDWHNYAYVYDGFGTDCTYAQILINRNGIVFNSVPSVDLPGNQDIDGPDAVWDDGTYYFGASWYVVLFNGPYIVFGPNIGGAIPSFVPGSSPGFAPGVNFGGGITPTGPSVGVPATVEGGAGGNIDQPPIGLHVWQKSGGF